MRWLLFILIAIILSGFSYAQIDISLIKDELTNKETLQANISIIEEPFETLSPSNFYIDDTKTPIILNKINEIYYAYIELPELTTGEHSLNIKTKYLIDGILTEKTFEKKFNIKEVNYSAITINPGFIKLDTEENNPYFKIYLKNNGNQEVILSIHENVDFAYPSRTTITIQPQQTNYFYLYTTLKDKEIKETTIEIKNNTRKSDTRKTRDTRNRRIEIYFFITRTKKNLKQRPIT